MISPNHGNVIFLQVLGVLFFFFSWLLVFRSRISVDWGRGANRLLVSRKGRLAFAIAATGWCMGVFGANQRLALGLFATGFAAAFIYAQEDEKKHIARTDIATRRTARPQDFWLAFCLIEAVLLPIVLFAVLREHFHPPITDEQKGAHAIGVLFLLLLSLGAVALYWKRPGKTST